jgi:hypothetical protein
MDTATTIAVIVAVLLALVPVARWAVKKTKTKIDDMVVEAAAAYLQGIGTSPKAKEPVAPV